MQTLHDPWSTGGGYVAVPNGIFTVALDDGHVTIRLAPAFWAKNLPDGAQVAAFLSGPNNRSDYTRFAFVVNGEMWVWNRFRGARRPISALNLLLAGGLDAALDAGEAYALASRRCWRCQKRLTVPASIHRGLGPVCAAVIAGDAPPNAADDEVA
jgi:hypothetical protein